MPQNIFHATTIEIHVAHNKNQSAPFSASPALDKQRIYV